jgi:hypothetical protein|tara:strand:+ start:251 stop:814 length:564 start_codon:yes stop_codon:yes gene_type:complete
LKTRQNVVEILLNAVSSIGGVQNHLDTEDIAQKAYKISSSAFCWKKYKDQIDLNKVKVNLYLAHKRGFITGNEKKGWMLSDKGLDAIQKAKNKNSNGFKLRTLKKDKIESEREIARISNNDTFLNYIKSHEKPNLRQMQGIFKIDNYTSFENKSKRVRKVINLCKSNSEIFKFLNKNKQIITKGKRG